MAKLIDDKKSYGIGNQNEGNNNTGSSKRVSFYKWKDGDNVVRLIGEPIMVRTYYLPKSSYNATEIFNADAFNKETNEHAIPKVINCPDWNIEERKFENNGDVLRSLNKIANEMLKIGKENGLPPAELKKWEGVRSKTMPTLQYKWLCFDRDMPYVVEDGRIKEPKELTGYQIITLSKTLFEMVIAAQEAYGSQDIFDKSLGCDIVFKKSIDAKTKKAVWAVNLKMNGRMVAETPLTEEELKLEMPNLLQLSGRQIPNELIMSNLLGEYAEMINDPSFEEVINANYTSYVKSSSAKSNSTANNIEDDSAIDDEDNGPF